MLGEVVEDDRDFRTIADLEDHPQIFRGPTLSID